MNKFFIYLLLFIPISSSLCGLEVKYCKVTNPTKHEFNRRLLSTVLEQELASLNPQKTPADQADYLRSRISQISDKLLKHGFLPEAYGTPSLDQNSIISFYSISLWEGEKNSKASIPISFFVYIWPSKELALKYNASDPRNRRYGSNIHSHPVSCAFAVLQGTLIQNNYELVSSRQEGMVRLTGKEIFHRCEGSIDDLNSPFIHQLYGKDSGSTPCLSLHAYGISSEKKMMACYNKTLVRHIYREILQHEEIVQD